MATYTNSVFARLLQAGIVKRLALAPYFDVQSDDLGGRIGDVFVADVEQIEGGDFRTLSALELAVPRETGTQVGPELIRDRITTVSTPITLEAAYKQISATFSDVTLGGLSVKNPETVKNVVAGVARSVDTKVATALSTAVLFAMPVALSTPEELLAVLFDNQSELNLAGAELEDRVHLISSDLARMARASKDFRDSTLRGENTLFANGEIGFIAGGKVVEVASLAAGSVISAQKKGVKIVARPFAASVTAASAGIAFEDTQTVPVGYAYGYDSRFNEDVLTVGLFAGAKVVDERRVIVRKATV